MAKIPRMYPLTDKLTNIRIGSAFDAKQLSLADDRDEWLVLNVSDPADNTDADVCIPLVYPIYTGYSLENCGIYTIEIPTVRLTVVATAILELSSKPNKKLMVHCAAGLERSPLAVAWYLHFYHMRSLAEAYKAVRTIRPQLWDRTAWIKYDSYYKWLRAR